MTSDANDKQIGGHHYKGQELEPWDIWAKWKLNPFQATAIKHIARYNKKGSIQDLEKAVHYLEKLIELEKLGEGWLSLK